MNTLYSHLSSWCQVLIAILFSLPVCVWLGKSLSAFTHARAFHFAVIRSSRSARSITGCPGCSVTREREMTWWPLWFLMVSRQVPIRWLSRNERLFVRTEDGWFSNNRTDTSLLVTKLDAFVLPRGAHTKYVHVRPHVIHATWTMSLATCLTEATPRTVCTVAHVHTYTRTCFSFLKSENHVLSLTLSVKIFSKYECTIYKKCEF